MLTTDLFVGWSHRNGLRCLWNHSIRDKVFVSISTTALILNMKNLRRILSILILLVAGCATLDISRIVDVEVARVESPHLNGLTSTAAVELLRDVSDQFGFTIKGPIRVTETEV